MRTRPIRRALLGLVACAFGQGCGAPSDSHTLDSLERRRADALRAGDVIEATLATLDRNRHVELAREDASPGAIERRYELLRRIALREASDRELLPERDGPVLPIAYARRELEEVRKTFARFGDLYVAPAEPVEVAVQPVPWAGFWYPLTGTESFGRPDSPLAKLDRLSELLGRAGSAVEWERRRHAAMPAASWEGHCAAWTVAAIATPEPSRSIEWEGVTFTVADQKALLTKVHETYPVEQLGVRYNGDDETDGTFQDLRPEAFHRATTVMLAEQRRAILVDDTPGVEVWSKPLHRMRWQIRQDPERPDAVLVTAFPWFTKQRSRETTVATYYEDMLATRYDYRLYLDPETTLDGKALVIAGEWVGASRSAHPDYIGLIGEDGPWGSVNPALNASLSTIRELFERDARR